MKRLKILSNSDSDGGACSTSTPVHIEPGQLVERNQFRGRAAVVTLGCAKNQVDSEVMVGTLRAAGFDIVESIDRADVAVVNTCGFLESAVKESIDCVLELSDLRRSGRLKKLLVAGCMVERYKGDIRKALPEVDAFIALDGLLQVGALAANDDVHDELFEGSRPYFLYDERTPRELSMQKHTAFVKISEGCNRPCAFCIIPQIRGTLRSRTVDSVVREVAALGSLGVKEINLVAQDLTAFGNDSHGEPLARLLRELDKSSAVPWIRLLYAYPIGVSDELLAAIVESPTICDYLDVPLQHASERVLRSMKRPIGRYGARRFVESVRSRQAEIKLRTTFIVGFPGETEEDIDELERFVAEGHFESVGVFTYSQEEGTPAAALSGQVPEKEKRARRERVMLAQQTVQFGQNTRRIGQEFQVLIDGPHEETDLLIAARTRFQAPEVDSKVIINNVEGVAEVVSAGYLGRAIITEVSGYDLVGTLVA